MHEIPLWVLYVSEREHIQLFIAIAAIPMQWKKDGPGDETPNARYHTEYFQISQEEEPIERGFVENFGVGHVVKCFHPIEPSFG